MLTAKLQSDMAALAQTLTGGLHAAGNVVDLQVDSARVAAAYGQGITPSKAEVYQAALLYLKGAITEDIEYLYDILPFGFYVPIEAAGNRTIAADHRKLDVLLQRYRYEAAEGTLWLTTWQGVLQAYFQPELKFSEQEVLRCFLVETWPHMQAQAGFHPLWMKVLGDHFNILGHDPCGAFVAAWLDGDRAVLTHVAGLLRIDDNSWFWQELTRSAIRHAAHAPDDVFKKTIPRILSLIDERPRFRDEDLAAVLTRYSHCADTSVHDDLKAYALLHWKNPRRRAVSVDTPWMQVREPVWRMALVWANDDALRLFFERISARLAHGGDRLSSWLRYVAWARFVVAYEARGLNGQDLALIHLFEEEEAALSLFDDGWDDRLDNFLVKISRHISTHCDIG